MSNNTETAIKRIKDAKKHINHVIGMLGVLRAAHLTSEDGTVCDDTTVDECVSGGEETLFSALRQSDEALKALGAKE